MKNNQSIQLLLPLNLETEVRDFHGYFQYLQEYEQPLTSESNFSAFIIKAKWMFYVTGFIGTAGQEEKHCHVLMFDRSKKIVPIDSKGRITINGKKYSQKFWNH